MWKKAKPKLCDVEVYLHRETEKAFLVALTEEKEGAVWVPKSQCELEPSMFAAQPDRLTGPEWLLKEKGLI